MSYIQIGELYLVKEYCWFLYPTKELAEAMCQRHGVGGRGGWVANNAKLLSERYKCNISVVEPNTCVVLLEVDGDYFKLLDCNGNIGWIICRDFSIYFERVKANQ